MIARVILVTMMALLVAVGAGAQTQGFGDVDKYFTAANIGKLEAGETVILNHTFTDEKGNAAGSGLAMILIERPVKDVWNVLIDFSAYPQFMPRVVSTKEYFHEGNSYGIDYTIKVMVKKIRYHILRTRKADEGILTYRIDKSKKNDIADTHGFWVLRPHGENRCILVYSVVVDSGISVPKSIQNYLTRRDLPGLVGAVKKRAETIGGKNSG